ncbi:MAG TPA: nucleotidyltransferase family protein [Candidatus Binataceae bacterium]|nr:nucleotidyltransferase family protein [Candidatus Binataceae bacterium]
MSCSFDKLPSEFRLLLACLHWPLADDDRARIRTLIAQPFKAEEFLDLVQHHQVAPLVFRNLDNAARDLTPATLLSNLRARAANAGRKSLRRVMETLRIAAQLKRASIEVRVLKGIALSIHAYRDATLQDSIDIDLLVPAQQVFEAESVLVGCGYRRIDPLARLTPHRRRWLLNHAHHIALGHSQTHEKVELHWGLTPNPFKHPGFVVEGTPTEYITLAAHQIPSLSAQDMFLHACVHGAEHYWSRLKWLAQIAAMTQAMTSAEFAAVASRAAEFGVTAEMAAAIALTEHYQLTNHREVDVSSEISVARDRILNRSMIASEGASDHSNHNAIVEFRDEWRAGSSFGYRRNLIERTIIRDESWELLDLPDALFYGYALLAPFALMKHRKRMRARRATSRQRVYV